MNKGEFMATASVVNVDGARVAYRLHGCGPAVVLVNGTAALDAHWGPVIAEFSKHRTVISLDYQAPETRRMTAACSVCRNLLAR
jgi:hypothetical protein